MTLSHEQARLAASQALDGALPGPQRAALALHLAECAECSAYAAQLEQAHARMAQSLQQRWPAEPLEAERMAALLHTTRKHLRRNAMQTRILQSTRPFAWGVPVIILILVLSWSIRSLRPGDGTPASLATTQAAETTAAATLPVEISPTPQPNQPTPAVTAETPAASNPLRALVPGENFRLQADLPAGPGQVTIYQQVLPGPLTPQQALEHAARLGIARAQVLIPDNAAVLPPNSGYIVSNGHAWAYQRPFASDIDFWNAPGSGPAFGQDPALPEDRRTAVAEAFLAKVDGLPADYRSIPSPYDDKLVGIVPQVDGLPVYTQVGEPRWDWINVMLDQGGVQAATIQGLEVKAVGTTPILSAEQAWQRLLGSPTWQKSRYAVINPAHASAQRRWQPVYPLGQTLELYGYIHHTWTESGERWIMFSDFARVEASDPNVYNQMYALQQDSSVHVWGQLHRDEGGWLWLKIERWEPIELLYFQYSGRLVREGDQSLIETHQGRFTLVPGAPEQMADGTQLDISAFALKGDSLQWWRMESGALGSNYRASLSCATEEVRGGLSGALGSFGGGKLRPVQMPDLAALPEDAFSAAYPSGTQLAGQSGQLNATIYRRPDGEHTSLALKIAPENGLPGGLVWLTEGALDGLPAFHGRPVQVWGTVTGQQDGWPTLRVERVVEQYPGVTLQRFVGKRSAGMMGGQMRVEFVTESGEHYQLYSGLYHWTNDMMDEILSVGENTWIEIEGFVIPDQISGGSPVLYDITREYPADPTTTGLEPLVVDQTGSDPNSTVTFTQVELAYLTANRFDCTQASPFDPQQAANLLLQPVWIFRGVLADGRLIEVQVQALPDELLK